MSGTARRELVEPLKDSGKGGGGGFRGRRLNRALVVAEVALSLVLLAGAGLLMRSFVKLQTVDLGLDPENVLTARLPLPRGQYETAAAKRQFFRQVPALRRRPPRSRHSPGGDRGGGARGFLGLLLPGPARHPGGPDGGLAIRVSGARR